MIITFLAINKLSKEVINMQAIVSAIPYNRRPIT